MVHEGDTLRDMKMNADRQVFIGPDGDWELTHGTETVKQSVVIHSGNVLRPLVGGPITAQKIQRAESKIEQALDSDPQVDDVRRVEIRAIDKDNNTVEVSIFADVEHEFEIGDIL